MTAATDVDAIVVGAGPSGLACAAALAGKKVLLLDRDNRHGGRIRTVDLGGQRVDLGACFAFDPTILPAGWSVDAGRMLQERAAMALCDERQSVFAATPRGGLIRLGVGAETLEAIDAVARLSADAAELQGSRAHAWLDALLHQVHPGHLPDYAPRHQRDGLFTWYPDHWERGNSTLTDALLARSGAELMLNAEVVGITARGSHVDVDVKCDGAAMRFKGRAVVVATTADVAASLFDWPDLGMRELLAATRYAGYLVVALAGPATPRLGTFRSLVRVDGSPALVVQQRSFERDRAVLLCYYCGKDFDDSALKSDTELIKACRSSLAAWGLDVTALDALVEAAIHRWPQGGTVLSSRYLDARAEISPLGSDRVFLAGDYVAGYGVADALRTGLRAAGRVLDLLAR